jgi:hypothetical protein
MQSFHAFVEWHGTPREVIALAADGDPLIGMSLLRGSRLSIDVINGGEVRIDALG